MNDLSNALYVSLLSIAFPSLTCELNPLPSPYLHINAGLQLLNQQRTTVLYVQSLLSINFASD